MSLLWVAVLALPLFALAVFRVYENSLVRQTEELLVFEAGVVGEAARQALDEGAVAPLGSPSRGPAFVPIEPRIDLRRAKIFEVAKRAGTATTTIEPRWRPLTALLERTRARNLTGVRVLDPRGRVVASPTREVGYSLAHLPEVRAAMEGRYEPALHERARHDSEPPVSSLSRAGALHVSIAVPIFAEPRTPVDIGAPVIGIVYNSRTPTDLEKSVWGLRDELSWPVAVTLTITLLLVLGLSRMIVRPLVELERGARAVAAGQRTSLPFVGGLAPREIRALSRTIEGMRSRLEQRAQYMRVFAANAAHELKSPLTSLRGAAELMLDAAAGGAASMTPEQHKKFLENIHEDAIRMNGIVQQLLLLARVESSSPVSLRMDARQIAEGIAERFRRRGHDVTLSGLSEELAVDADPELIEAALGNLLENAIRHGTGEVALSARREGSGIAFAVRNQGPPVPDESLSRFFERFFTTERARGGTGLGLAIVKAVAEAHGGRAWVVRRDDGLEVGFSVGA
ncbi:MAG: HAMP domain-containing protein [Deltaproteobacteria bacterium]|nr:HAMP domain-containing protein [Deltaproteobacteria bacterium]